MALRAVTPRRPGQPELPDRAGEQGHSASAALSARVGRAPGSRLRLRGPRLRLRGPRALIFVVLGIVLSAAAASAMPTGQDRVHQQLAAPQGWRRSFWELCPPGYHVSADGNSCTPCANGVEFTTHWNVLPSCLPCTTCKSGEEESTPCTTTKDTQCQCRAGTFHGEDSPEFCQKCSTGCPDGMIVAKRCTPWSDLQCVDQKLGNSQLVPGIETAFALLVLVLVLMAAYCFRKFIPQGCGVDPKCMEKVFFWRSHPPRGPEPLDNARNNMLINRESLSTVVSEQETEDQEQANLTCVMVQSPGEAERLLEAAGAKESQMRRRMLVPANDVDSIEGLRMFFDYFATVVPYDSWDALMRQMGLTQNEILMARGKAWAPRDALYQMLEAWLSSKGREASINTLLDALETLGQRCAKEKIQNCLVGSGKFVYEVGEAGSAVS
ncbi:tumor necrosis factor receptor superfamily member 10A isoform X2 [Camelus dromedarius]|uniref:tumor necrosis factor receptor superfamily member 10A isoform X2 n=1 Tax=Camelus dromedarius TaxID=9838 RepID=UPI0012635A4A|nr:tumor necrosis factor receptor superfamily member 10A-like isoform X2 [Camelus dromedarius]